MLTRRPSLSSWSILNCRTMPRKLFSWCTTTARCHSRTSGVMGVLPGMCLLSVTSGLSARTGLTGGATPMALGVLTMRGSRVWPCPSSGAAGLRSSMGLTRRTLSAAAASSMAALASICDAAALPCVASIHCTHGCALGSKIESSAPLESSATSRSSSSWLPFKPPYTNTNGPTDATACRQRRVKSSLLPPVLGTDCTHWPALVSSTTVDVASSTILPPPTAPPDMCSRLPTNTAPCWYLPVGMAPGAACHSHRPSLCLAKP
mmetsp:Transcript_21598/g.59896  ORF Transcript_21598/g.59896 Transcript_21598/m.59896 type:complete len:262 (-) Transcript_21598:912-1697(-)